MPSLLMFLLVCISTLFEKKMSRQSSLMLVRMISSQLLFGFPVHIMLSIYISWTYSNTSGSREVFNQSCKRFEAAAVHAEYTACPVKSFFHRRNGNCNTIYFLIKKHSEFIECFCRLKFTKSFFSNDFYENKFHKSSRCYHSFRYWWRDPS